jgi:acetyl-CoA carboxylase carboxyl transferase subunit beta
MPIKLPFRRRDGDQAFPPDLWTQCPSCQEMLYNKQLDKNLRVCPKCGHHLRLRADARLGLLLDSNTFEERDAGLESLDPLGFVDTKAYPERVSDARANTGIRDAAVWGFGAIAGNRVAICVMDFAFMGGSMGSVVGEKVTRAAEAALAERIPLIVVSASGGARMQEGTLALMQLAKSVAALERLGRAGVPYISLMTDPTTGGVFASFAALGDVNVAEPGSLIGFAGARVAAGTTGEALPEGFQRAEFLFAHGFVDMVVPRAELRERMATLLGYLRPRVAVVDGGTDAGAGGRMLRPLAILDAISERVADRSADRAAERGTDRAAERGTERTEGRFVAVPVADIVAEPVPAPVAVPVAAPAAVPMARAGERAVERTADLSAGPAHG